MKKNFLLIALFLFVLSLNAADIPYCYTSAFGYGAIATGGGNATPTLVSDVSGLKKALSGSNKVVIITKDITVTSMISVENLKNITLLALPGVKLSNLQTSADNSGVLFVKRSSNIIIRNITFIGPGAYDVDGNDLLCFEGVTNAWVDHCDFQDGLDGNFDNKSTTDNITVSWCRFRYLKKPIAGGSGGSDDHRYSNLLGSGAYDAPSDGTYNFTWAYCWWDYGCKQRMVRCRNASLHFLNCYWNTSVADYYIGPENADAYVEGCWMAKLKSGSRVFYENFNSSSVKNGVKYVNSYYEGGSLPNVTNRTVLTPTYAYTALSYTDAKDAVSNETCGAGATLNITTKGEISTSCGENTTEPTPVDPPEVPVTGNLTWSADDSDIASLGTLTSSQTIRGLTIAATDGKTVVVDENAKTYSDGSTQISFAHRIKLGGTMSDVARHLKFDVTGACTIEVYCMSANSSSARPLNIAVGAWNNVDSQTDVTGTEVNRIVYNHNGGATTIYIGSGSSGINVLGINVTNKDKTGLLLNDNQTEQTAQKVIIDNQIYIIMPNGDIYSPLGAKIK